jgi:hypothetical protein
MASANLCRNALLKVEAGSEQQSALSKISGGLLKAFLFIVQREKQGTKGSRSNHWCDNIFVNYLPFSTLNKRFLKAST